MPKYHGQKGRVYISTNASGNAVQAVGLTSWSLDSGSDRVEVTSFEDTNKVYVQGKADISGEFSGVWDNATDNLFTAAASSDGVKLYLYPSADVTTKYWYGTAWVDASIEVGVDSAVTISGTFQAAGAWGRV